MRLTRRAMLRDLAVYEAQAQLDSAEIGRLRLQVASLQARSAPSYDERIRLARRAEEAEALAETWRHAAHTALVRLHAITDPYAGPEFPRSLP